jgi:hypothetical protein
MSILTEIASGATGGLLGGVGQLAKDIREAITGDLPAEKQAEITQKLMELENSAMQAQTAINLEEAKSEKLFVSGWRPFIGWVCGCAFAYAAIGQPAASWAAKVWGYAGSFPTLDTTITMQVLIGMLGLGAYRSYDKKQSPACAGKE